MKKQLVIYLLRLLSRLSEVHDQRNIFTHRVRRSFMKGGWQAHHRARFIPYVDFMLRINDF
jgi:hypothetical protein